MARPACGRPTCWPPCASACRAQLTSGERQRYALDRVAAGNESGTATGGAARSRNQGLGSAGLAATALACRRGRQGDGLAGTVCASRLARATRKKLRLDVLALRRTYPGTPQALAAAELLTRLPSPFDALTSKTIPREERFAKQPKELVAVLGEQRLRHHEDVRGLAISPDGKVVASSSNRVRLWDALTGKSRGELPGGLFGFVPQTGALVTHSEKKVHFWDVSGDAPRELRSVSVTDWGRALSPDGKTMVTVGLSGAVRLWALDGDKASVKGRPGRAQGLRLWCCLLGRWQNAGFVRQRFAPCASGT